MQILRRKERAFHSKPKNKYEFDLAQYKYISSKENGTEKKKIIIKASTYKLIFQQQKQQKKVQEKKLETHKDVVEINERLSNLILAFFFSIFFLFFPSRTNSLTTMPTRYIYKPGSQQQKVEQESHQIQTNIQNAYLNIN